MGEVTDEGATLTLLKDIIKEKKFVVKDSVSKWSDAIPLIQQRIDFVLGSIYNEPGIGAIVSESLADDDNLHEVLRTLRLRIVSNIENRFGETPPFTVLRLAEVLLNPQETYSTALKFLRALYTITSVTSTHSIFPLGDIAGNKDTIQGSTVVQQSLTGDDSQTVMLTKIGWLTQEDLEEVGSENYMLFEEQTEVAVEDQDEAQDRDQNADQRELKNEDDYKKRKVEGESHHQSTPEKKYKLSKEESTEPGNGVTAVKATSDHHGTAQDDNVFTNHSDQVGPRSPDDNMDVDGVTEDNVL